MKRAEAQAAAEPRLVSQILADIERARGPATRRAALARGLDRVTRQDLRELLLIESARIETRAVLDKADALKSTAAKRRYLEDGLAALRADVIADELQAREIELLEAALSEITAK